MSYSILPDMGEKMGTKDEGEESREGGERVKKIEINKRRIEREGTVWNSGKHVPLLKYNYVNDVTYKC